MELRCDGKNDCLDHSDETDCEADEVDGTIFYNSTCDMHTCENGQCISKEWLCDGIVHCDDNSDEKYCPEIPKMATEIVATVVIFNFPLCLWPILQKFEFINSTSLNAHVGIYVKTNTISFFSFSSSVNSSIIRFGIYLDHTHVRVTKSESSTTTDS